jgi:hypothetical protein
MEFAVVPPSRVAAGVRLRYPLVVTFSSGSSPPRDKHAIWTPCVLRDLSGIWVFLSLTTADTRENLAPPREDLFSGKRADSIHPVQLEQMGDRPTLAFATFPDLVFTKTGRYRIRVNIIDMNTYGTSGIKSSKASRLMWNRAFQGDQVGDAGRVMPSLYSPVFEVVEGCNHGASGEWKEDALIQDC